MLDMHYSPLPGCAWFHFLHEGDLHSGDLDSRAGEGGDWALQPAALPDGLEARHLDRLRQLVCALDAPSTADFSLTFANLSLHDPRNAAGQGCVALLLHFRVSRPPG